uniref:Uncharacterized protein n=1 Tax=Magallana gigas TaxID=29159 RepID=K1R800_MAGGI
MTCQRMFPLKFKVLKVIVQDEAIFPSGPTRCWIEKKYEREHTFNLMEYDLTYVLTSLMDKHKGKNEKAKLFQEVDLSHPLLGHTDRPAKMRNLLIQLQPWYLRPPLLDHNIRKLQHPCLFPVEPYRQKSYLLQHRFRR